MSFRQRGLRLLGLGVAFALALGLLAACGDEKPPQTIVNENVGERTEPETTQETVETTEETTEEEAEVEEEAEEPAEAAVDGKQVFTTAGCAACHTLADAGASGQVGPSFDEVSIDAEAAAETITNGRGAMPPFSGQLSDEEIQAVAEYVSSQN